jgi:(p)ppGpp synthase/HD superfamily hydrolase
MEKTISERALEFAINAHANQTDKAGKPYIEHVKRVASNLQDEELRAIAYLHDVIEDTTFTAKDISDEFGYEIACDVQALSRNKDEAYADFIKRISKRSRAVKVKMNDLKDNLDLSRLPSVSKLDLERAEKYKMALSFLELIEEKKSGVV